MKKVIFAIILLFNLVCFSFSYAQTSLSPGDIVMVTVNSDGNDEFDFVTLLDIEVNTTIYFSDEAWILGTPDHWRGTGEGVLKYTAPSNISAGSIISCENSADPSSPFEEVGAGFNLSDAGDNIIIYQGSETYPDNPEFLYIIGFARGDNLVYDSGNGTTTSDIPSTLSTGAYTAFQPGAYDNYQYNGETIFSTPSEFLAAAANSSNWIGNSSTPYSAYAYSITLPVTLSTFTAQYLNSKPTLYWQTQSEEDNMGWFIYRNTIEDFTSAEKISDMIPGHGTTTQPQSYIYEDAEQLQVEQTYYYWLESVDYSGAIHHFDMVAHVTIPHPNDPGQNITPPAAYEITADPNPFSYTTNISFVMDQPSLVDVAIYNVKGQLVKSFNSAMTSQENETVDFSWNGKSDAGKTLSNGVYLYLVKVNGQDYATKQLILMK